MRRTVLRDAWKIAATYIGTVVGAGFASGQEVLQFFTKLGPFAVLTIAASALLFYVLGERVMFIGRKTGAQSFGLVASTRFGARIGRWMQVVMLIMLFGVTVTMVAGSGALMFEQWHIPIAAGSLFTVLLTGAVLFFGLRGVMSANSIIVPIMIGFIILVFLSRLTPHYELSLVNPAVTPLQAILSALSYAGFNVGLSVTVLIPLGHEAIDRFTLRLGAFMGALALGVMLLLIHLLLVNAFFAPDGVQIPMGYVAAHLPVLVRLVFIVTLWAEIFSTLVANIYGMAHEMARENRRLYVGAIALILAATYFGSQIGFGTMVSYAYPIFGYIGAIMLIAVLT